MLYDTYFTSDGIDQLMAKMVKHYPFLETTKVPCSWQEGNDRYWLAIWYGGHCIATCNNESHFNAFLAATGQIVQYTATLLLCNTAHPGDWHRQ